DFVWLLLFGALASSSPSSEPWEFALLGALAVVQIVEPKVSGLASARGRVFWIGLKLTLGYLLIGYTGGLASRYFPVLLLPVVSAATSWGIVGTMLFVLIAGGSYLSFLLFLDWSRYVVGLPEMEEIALRITFLAMVGNLANMLAADLRVQSENNR